MKLYVDDLRKCPEGWTLARNNTEAIRLLATGYVEEISIDHDICVPNVEFIDNSVRKRLAIGEETFQPVAYYLAAMKPELRPVVINFHTANPAGATKMMDILTEAGIESTYAEGSYIIDLGENEL
jgi:hypothetical protein